MSTGFGAGRPKGAVRDVFEAEMYVSVSMFVDVCVCSIMVSAIIASFCE